MKELDGIHCDFSAIDGLERIDNCVISPRHDGKSTTFLMKKTWPAFRKGKATALYFRQVNDANEFSLRYYINLMSPFLDRPLNPDVRGIGGVCAVLVDRRPLFYAIPLGMKEASLKKTSFPDVAFALFDEMEINPKNKERYLDNEFGRWQTLTDTMRKLSPSMKSYALTNPYSAYCPLFKGWGVRSGALKIDTMQKGKNWAVWFKSLNPALVAKIKEENPYFDESSEYGRWAFSGKFGNDANSHVVPVMLGGYRLAIRFSFEGERFSAFESTDYLDESKPLFYIRKEADTSKRRTTYAFDFGDMIAGTSLATKEDKDRFRNLKKAIRSQDVGFDAIETEHAFQLIYDYL